MPGICSRRVPPAPHRAPGALYHVTASGNRRASIRKNDADRERVLAVLAEVVGAFNWISHAYCLMGNHCHLLATPCMAAPAMTGSTATRADLLYGDAGDDWIEGNNGDDVIEGGDGADQIFGGPATIPSMGAQGMTTRTARTMTTSSLAVKATTRFPAATAMTARRTRTPSTGRRCRHCAGGGSRHGCGQPRRRTGTSAATSGYPKRGQVKHRGIRRCIVNVPSPPYRVRRRYYVTSRDDRREPIIAGIARSRTLTGDTRNTRDFDGCGFDVVNPFVKDS